MKHMLSFASSNDPSTLIGATKLKTGGMWAVLSTTKDSTELCRAVH